MATAVLACALAACTLLLFAAWCDLATRTIPDGASIALALIGLLGRGDDGLAAVASSLLVAALLFALLVPLHARASFGGGDIKLIVAMAIGLPPLATLDFLFSTVMAGGVLGAVYLTLSRLPRPSPLSPQPFAWRPRRVLALERRRASRRGPLPYAVAIAAGGILTVMKPLGG